MVDMVTWQPGGETGHGRHGHLVTWWRWLPGNLVERQDMVDMVTWQPGGETGHGRHGHLATWWRDSEDF